MLFSRIKTIKSPLAMPRYFKMLFILCLFASCTATSQVTEETTVDPPKSAKIVVGAENTSAYLPQLKAKNIALVANQTSLVNGVHLLDFLVEEEIIVSKVFCLEHGFRGNADAGAKVADGKDVKTGVSLVSLYGSSKKPKITDLASVDIVVFDIQDVGARFYTYISSLHYIMEACAENNVEVMVLDRPNPHIADINGPVLESAFKSFVGMHPIPVLHGMTIGEYAQMINGEKWLKNGVQAKLTIVPVLNYTRTSSYSLPVPPSPNLPNDTAIALYPSLCFFEGTPSVSVGRGTIKPFQQYGSPSLENLFTKYFVPKAMYGASAPRLNGEKCFGEQLSPEVVEGKNGLDLSYLVQCYAETTEKDSFFSNFFNQLAGTAKLKKQIIAGLTLEQIEQTWQADLRVFKLMRTPYLLYK